MWKPPFNTCAVVRLSTNARADAVARAPPPPIASTILRMCLAPAVTARTDMASSQSGLAEIAYRGTTEKHRPIRVNGQFTSVRETRAVGGLDEQRPSVQCLERRAI